MQRSGGTGGLLHGLDGLACPAQCTFHMAANFAFDSLYVVVSADVAYRVALALGEWRTDMVAIVAAGKSEQRGARRSQPTRPTLIFRRLPAPRLEPPKSSAFPANGGRDSAQPPHRHGEPCGLEQSGTSHDLDGGPLAPY